MKPILNALSLLLILFMCSCGANQDILWINSDGSIRFETVTDMSNEYDRYETQARMAQFDTLVEKGPMENILIPLILAGEADTLIPMIRIFLPQDSIIDETFEQALKEKNLDIINERLDSILQVEQSKLDGSENAALMIQWMASALNVMINTDVHLEVSNANRMIKFTGIQKVDSFNDLYSIENIMLDAVSITQKGKLSNDATIDMDVLIEGFKNAQTFYKLDKNTLMITREGIDLTTLGDAAAMLLSIINKTGDTPTPYSLTVHFPGKIKEIKSDNAIQIDKKTIMIEVPFEELYQPGSVINTQVTFKGLKNKKND